MTKISPTFRISIGILTSISSLIFKGTGCITAIFPCVALSYKNRSVFLGNQGLLATPKEMYDYILSAFITLIICTFRTPTSIFCTGRFDDKQGGDTIVSMERVREAIAFNSELVDQSTWFWLTLEQMGFPLRLTGGGEHEKRAEDLDSSQRVRDHLVAYHLAPAITDLISDENQKCCNNDLEQTLMLLHSE